MEETYGTLYIRVFTSRAELPVEDATVVVTQWGKSGKYQLLTVQITDREGKITPVRIPAPARWESETPNTKLQPFATCQVWAEHPGFAMLRVDGVQIFPGIETVQNMELIPLAEGQHSLQEREVREITAQNL